MILILEIGRHAGIGASGLVVLIKQIFLRQAEVLEVVLVTEIIELTK